MGIFGGGSNLPPGCSVSDIPGNRPEDCAQEEMELAFYENEPNKHGQKRFTPKEWKYLGSKNRTCLLEDIIWKAIEYGMNIGRQEADNINHDNRGYELHFIEEAIEQATTPQEALDKIKNILGIGQQKKVRK